MGLQAANSLSVLVFVIAANTLPGLNLSSLQIRSRCLNLACAKIKHWERSLRPDNLLISQNFHEMRVSWR